MGYAVGDKTSDVTDEFSYAFARRSSVNKVCSTIRTSEVRKSNAEANLRLASDDSRGTTLRFGYAKENDVVATILKSWHIRDHGSVNLTGVDYLHGSSIVILIR